MSRPVMAGCCLVVLAMTEVLSAVGLSSGFVTPAAAELEVVDEVEPQPLAAAVRRLREALATIGEPLTAEQNAALDDALEQTGEERVTAIQRVLDPLCLAAVHINPESRVKVSAGPTERQLIRRGWRSFLVKVDNEGGVTAPLSVGSPQARPMYRRSSGSPEPEQDITPAEAADRWLEVGMFDERPLSKTLSGLRVEYRIVQLYSRDEGAREATLSFSIGTGSEDLGGRNSVSLLFDCRPAVKVLLGLKDHDGSPATASFVIRDQRGRVYPNRSRRTVPDFFFHDQVYRSDGDVLSLPPGEFTVEVTRGPEYLIERQQFTVEEETPETRAAFGLTRWVHPAARGWFSGDHHVHAAGCSHYESPTQGVLPADMFRHIQGEDLNVGCVLTWGPCWYFQKQFFEGDTSELSTPQSLMRYDVEVSGFPSSHAGHLCLLRLTEDDFPGTNRIEHWPSWTLPVLKWAKEQGGVVGYAHSGWGLALPDHARDGRRVPNKNPWGGAAGEGLKAAHELPDYEMPPFDGIGANEYVVTAAHDACDFISTVDTPSIWELNVWYHVLNCGFQTRISGETDFPCIYDSKVGLGRVYVKLPTDEPVTFDNWVAGLKAGRSYCGDGRSHVFDFAVTAGNDANTSETDAAGAAAAEGGVAVGEPGPDGRLSTLSLPQGGPIRVTADVAALLSEETTAETEQIRNSRLDAKPYWHIERCRIGDSRRVNVELIVNGEAVESRAIEADGKTRPLSFGTTLDRSSWVALRILPSVHTNPIWVEVDGQPVRANRRSAEWCRKAVDVCWNSKKNQIHDHERPAAQAAYDLAATIYELIADECPPE